MSASGKKLIGKWAALLAAPTIWGIHLLLVYTAVSLEITLRGEAGLISRIAVALITLACLVAVFVVGRAIARGTAAGLEPAQEDLADLWRKASFYLAILSFIAILWQGLPAIFIPGDPVSHHAIGGGINLPDAGEPL